MFDWLKALFARDSSPRGDGTITRTCKYCGKTFTLPEDVQHWPSCCQACRAKYRPAETVTSACRGCGRRFSFASSARPWPKYCPDCRAKRRR